MSNKKRWSDKDLNDFKKIIEKKKQKALQEMGLSKNLADDILKNNSVNSIYSSHIADAASDQEQLEKAYYWVARDNKHLQYLFRAMEMIDKKTFGICLSCEELIEKERLIEVPHTTKCFSCKSAV